uniref:Lipocalin/cytosolic fatty-acid binding domain-containing protein n=1 Tax=Homalodisca liturata TaxID=320908 RepID=A0A1B6IBU0_9HEMI
MYTFVLVLFSATLVHSTDVRSLCYGVCPIRRHPSSVEGMWWIVLATETTTGQCGLYNNQCPCKCIGFKFTSCVPEPYIHRYNVTIVGYDTRDCCYDEEPTLVKLVDVNSPYLVVTQTNLQTGESVTVAVLDTDDGRTFLLCYVCDLKTKRGDPVVFVLSRDIKGLCPATIKRIYSTLIANNINPNCLKPISRRNCPIYVG